MMRGSFLLVPAESFRAPQGKKSLRELLLEGLMGMSLERMGLAGSESGVVAGVAADHLGLRVIEPSGFRVISRSLYGSTVGTEGFDDGVSEDIVFLCYRKIM